MGSSVFVTEHFIDSDESDDGSSDRGQLLWVKLHSNKCEDRAETGPCGLLFEVIEDDVEDAHFDDVG